jgi:hypothetical protein
VLLGRFMFAVPRDSVNSELLLVLNGDPPGPAAAAPDPPAARRPGGHPGRLIAILVLIAALAVGWPLASGAVSGNKPLAAGTVLPLGPDSGHLARFTIGPGWVLNQSDSNPKMNYVLQNGSVRLDVVYVWLITRSEAGNLWSGLRRLLQAGNPAAQLSQPATSAGSHGLRGQTGVLRQRGQVGQATIYLAPGKTFAIELISLGPPGALSSRLAARNVIGSLRFVKARR